jgi:tryptophanyl-tRNA synthetase
MKNNIFIIPDEEIEIIGEENQIYGYPLLTGLKVLSNEIINISRNHKFHYINGIDLGCGDGQLINHFNKTIENSSWTGIELSSYRISLSINPDIQELACSQVFYPVMQCADIFFLGIDICSLGMDQRKVNSLALEYCDKIKRKNKPIIISHHMVMGLDGSDKMSKSNPDNAIFMDDNESEVKRKITKAFCEPKNIEKNPLLDWAKHIIFPITKKMIIPENPKWNEPEIVFENYEELQQAFKEGKVQPKGLKDSMIKHINDLIKPIKQKLKP